MKKIPLTQGRFTLVDDADYEQLNKQRWYAYQDRNTWYARSNSLPVNDKKFSVLMHRVILGLQHGDKRQCDHIDGDGLNNQQSNLRICNHKQNQHNRRQLVTGRSKYKGVAWNGQSGRWAAQIRCHPDHIYIGLFDTEEAAAEAYNEKAKELHGEYAYLNDLETVGATKDED